MANKTHDLKVHTHFWDDLASGHKNFEVRRNDRGYQVGDVLRLRSFDPVFGLTGESLLFDVTYILYPENMPGIVAGWVIMGIKPHG